MSSIRILGRVAFALYYVFQAARDGMHRELTVLQKLPSPYKAELLQVSSPTNSSNTPAHRANGRREGGRQGERESEGKGGRGEGKGGRGRESVNMIATINTSSTRILARVALALFQAARDGMQRELTRLQKLPSPCRAELLRVSSPTNSSNTTWR